MSYDIFEKALDAPAIFDPAPANDPGFDTVFQYCIGNILDSRVKGDITLRYFVHKIRTPKPETADILARVRTTDGKEKAALKQKLPSFSPCVIFKPAAKRRLVNIQAFTGIMMLDFDKIPDAPGFKHYLFDAYPYVLAAWLSASAKGVRAMVRIPECENPAEFKRRFAALASEMDQYKGFDHAPKNCVLPLFYSADPEIRFDLRRTGIFRKIASPPPPPQSKLMSWEPPSDRVKRWAMERVKKAIDKITDNGHPQLRAAAYVLGGYVGSGTVDQFEAEQFINALIDSNGYLSQKPDVYKTTAKTMIQKGQEAPLTV